MSTLKTNNIQHVDRSDPSIIINTDGSVNIAGTMTYEDVTNVDSVGIVTARGLSIFGNTTGLQVSGIATVTNGKIQVFKGTSGGAAANTDAALILDNSTHTYIQFRTPDTKEQGLLFGDDADNNVGSITYSHSTNALSFAANASERLRITSGGLVAIGTATARAQFDVLKSTGNVIALFEGSNTAQNHRVRIDASGTNSTTGLSISNSNSNNQTSLYHSGGNNNMVIMGGQTAGAEPTSGTAVATFASGGDVTVNTGNLTISQGRLLIGTTTEGEASADDLTIAGSGNQGITIRSGTTNYGLIYFSDATSGTAEYAGAIEYKHDDNFMVFRTSTGERVKITNNGRVLIGSGAVSASSNLVAQGGLQVSTNGASGAPTLCLGADGTGANTQSITDNTAKDCRIGYPNYDIQEEPLALISGFVGDGSAIDGNSGARIYIGGGTSYLNAVNQIRFYTTAGNQNTTSGTERMRITSSGEMGLGTATPPTGSFHIHLTETPELNLFSTQHSQGNHCKLNFGVGQSASVSGNTGARIEMNIPNSGGAMNGELKFHTNSGDNLVEKVRIPASTWGLLVTNLASTGATGGYQTEGVSLRYSGDSTFVKTDAPPVTLTRKGNAGKVIDFYNATTYAGGIYVNGSGNTAIQQTSDYRLKTDVSSMTDGIVKVKLLNPIYFKNNTGLDTTTTQNGFLAHEIQTVLPTLVDGEKDGDIDERGKGYQTMDYAGLTPTLTAAVKELIEKVETLEAEVAALKGS